MHGHDDRSGAKQPERVDPAKAKVLEDPARFAYLPVEAVDGLLAIPSRGLVVDFGAGTGLYARALAALHPEATIVAWDEQPKMLELLRAKLTEEPRANVRPQLAGDAELAGLRGRVDRVLALNVLHELGDAALKTLVSMLAPGGRAVFIDWSAEVERPVGPSRDHVLSAAESESRLARFGLKAARRQLFAYHHAFVCELG
jgi:SAM-dependent methyltransferase